MPGVRTPLLQTSIYMIGIKPTISNSQRGVTLIELVVVLALFMAIIGVTVSIFISVVNQQRSILQQQAVLNQASYLTDYLSRAIRMSLRDAAGTCLTDEGIPHPGYIYLLTHRVSGSYQGVKFLSSNGVCQEIFLENGVLKEIKDGGQAQNILSQTMSVPQVKFVINGDQGLQGAGGADHVQPRVTFMINIQTQIQDVVKEVFIQSTVSQINLNF